MKPGNYFIHANLKLLYTGFVSLYMIIASCSDNTGGKRSSRPESNNSFVTYAERLILEKEPDCTIVTVKDPWQGAAGVRQTWYLVPEGSDSPVISDTTMIIRVPVRSIICMSTTHLAMITALDETGSISGASGTGFLYDSTLMALVKKGLIPEVGYEDNLNKELIMKIKPDLVMVYGVGSESAAYIGKLRELGIKVLYNADYLETDPLGKAEWIKLFGALYCKEKLADSIFSNIENEYNNLKILINKSTTGKPKILLGMPYKDTWFISPGNSYISRLIEDAGGDYLWKDTRSDYSMPYGIENVYIKAIEADYWLNSGSASSRNGISAIDIRLSDLQCFKNDNIYNNNKRISPGGGNDYWESGALNPHLILRDMAKILHPGIFDREELIYYTRLE